MNKRGTRNLLWGAFFILLFAGCSATASKSPTPENGLPIEEILKTVKDALADTEAILVESGLPSLESVTLTMQTKFVRTDDFGMKLLVVGGKSSLETSETNQLTLKLSPPPPKGTAPIASADLYRSLKRAIVGAAQASKAAREAGKPELELNSVAIDLEFSAKATSSGAIEIEVITVKVGGGRTEAKTGMHKISISFK